MGNMTIDTSLYIGEHTGSSSTSELSSDNKKTSVNLNLRRLKLNEFLVASGKFTLGQSKKPWRQLSSRTKNVYVSKARDAVVSALEVICPNDAGDLWDVLKKSQMVENALNIKQPSLADQKYLEALAETYQNAESWNTRRQVLSIMADLVPYAMLLQYVPGITEYRVKTARQHALQHGRGSALPATKNPRMRVNHLQLDHFLSFITSPHIVQDLPFGQRYLSLSNGSTLETPNVIRMLIPQRIVAQYRQYCEEMNFTPFSESTMLRILSSCSASVRKSLQGLDYIAADGAKAFDDLIAMVQRLGDDKERAWVSHWQHALKEGKQYIKADYKVAIC